MDGGSMESKRRYIYDGTFEGWLTSALLARVHAQNVEEITAEDTQPDLFSETIRVETDGCRAEKLFAYLKKRYSEDIVEDIVYGYLSGQRGIEMALFRYLLLLLSGGEKAVGNYTDESVAKVKRVRDQVAHEILRFQGFVRFRRLQNNVYYAPIKPVANIVQFLAPHFTERFADQSWVIHDTTRNVGLFYDGRVCRYLDGVNVSQAIIVACHGQVHEDSASYFAEGEMDFQSLWNQYVNAAAIKERINPRLQRQRMPVRYWGYLVEQPQQRIKDTYD